MCKILMCLNVHVQNSKCAQATNPAYGLLKFTMIRMKLHVLRSTVPESTVIDIIGCFRLMKLRVHKFFCSSCLIYLDVHLNSKMGEVVTFVDWKMSKFWVLFVQRIFCLIFLDHMTGIKSSESMKIENFTLDNL